MKRIKKASPFEYTNFLGAENVLFKRKSCAETACAENDGLLYYSYVQQVSELWRETFDSPKYWFNSTIGMYRDHTQVERIKEKSDPHYGYSHLISMHAKRLESG